jgi:hypothetical protein
MAPVANVNNLTIEQERTTLKPGLLPQGHLCSAWTALWIAVIPLLIVIADLAILALK